MRQGHQHAALFRIAKPVTVAGQTSAQVGIVDSGRHIFVDQVQNFGGQEGVVDEMVRGGPPVPG